MMILIGKPSLKIKETKVINNIVPMKQKEYCTPEIVTIEAVSENVLCVSKVVTDENGNEIFGDGKFDEVDW